MAGAFTIRGKLDGLEPILAKLRTLKSGSGRGRMLKKALRKGARVLLKIAKAKVPVYEGGGDYPPKGVLKKSLGVKVKANVTKGTAYALVGARRGFRVVVNGRPYDPSRIYHLVEFGHEGPHAAPPYPSLRPAYDEGRAKAAEAIRESLEADIAKAIVKGQISEGSGGSE